MSRESNFDTCEQARRNLDDFYDQRNAKHLEISSLENEVLSQEDNLTIAENALSQTEEAIQNLADGAISLGVNLLRGNGAQAARDAVGMGITLATTKAKQQQEVQEQRRRLYLAEKTLANAKDALRLIERDIANSEQFIRTNCG